MKLKVRCIFFTRIQKQDKEKQIIEDYLLSVI